MSAFKTYDIRGIYNKDFDKETAYRIGFFLKELFGAEEIAVCRDIRISSDEIFESLAEGILDSGTDVCDYGYTTTPMSYYISFKKGYKTTVMITASHNPKEYNGFKISGPEAAPVGEEAGLLKLKELVENGEVVKSEKRGCLKSKNIESQYINYMKKQLKNISNLNISIDCSSGMSALIAKDIFGTENVNYILDEFDGEFKAHSPNPLDEASRKMITEAVKKNKSDVGIIFDGDADRVMFIDNKGRFVSPDLMINVLAYALLGEKEETVVVDIRSSKSCRNYIRLLGSNVVTWKVGHVFAKAKLRELDALFGGELAGHYYFKKFGYCDSAVLATIYILNTLAEFKRDNIYLADFIDEISNYVFSGEINFKVNDKEKIIEKLNEKYSKEGYTNFYDFDGIKYEFVDWWFNVRSSNTEPYLRLVMEAADKKLLDEKLKEITKIIESE